MISRENSGSLKDKMYFDFKLAKNLVLQLRKNCKNNEAAQKTYREEVEKFVNVLQKELVSNLEVSVSESEHNIYPSESDLKLKADLQPESDIESEQKEENSTISVYPSDLEPELVDEGNRNHWASLRDGEIIYYGTPYKSPPTKKMLHASSIESKSITDRRGSVISAIPLNLIEESVNSDESLTQASHLDDDSVNSVESISLASHQSNPVSRVGLFGSSRIMACPEQSLTSTILKPELADRGNPNHWASLSDGVIIYYGTPYKSPPTKKMADASSIESKSIVDRRNSLGSPIPLNLMEESVNSEAFFSQESESKVGLNRLGIYATPRSQASSEKPTAPAASVKIDSCCSIS